MRVFFIVTVITLCNKSEFRTFLNIGQNSIFKAMLCFNKNIVRQEKTQVWGLMVPWLMEAVRHLKLPFVPWRILQPGAMYCNKICSEREMGFFCSAEDWGLKESRQIIFRNANIGKLKILELIFLKLVQMSFGKSYIHLFEHCCLERMSPFCLAPILSQGQKPTSLFQPRLPFSILDSSESISKKIPFSNYLLCPISWHNIYLFPEYLPCH